MRLGAPLARTLAPFSFFYRNAEGSFRPFAAARCERTLAEREDISRGIASGSSIREIARGLERAASTVSRDVRASEADHQAWKSALRPRPCLLALHRKLRTMGSRP